MERTVDTRVTDGQINVLVQAGCNRWTKYGKDRLYINPEFIGLELSYYNTGNISDAYLDGERISNCYARKLIAKLDGSYINVENWHIYTDRGILDMIKDIIGGLPEAG